MPFPQERPRRMRRTLALRLLIRETDLSSRHLIAPLFVKEGVADPIPIPSMPGHLQHTLESLRKEAREIAAKGVHAFVLFGVPERKDPDGSVDNDRTLELYQRIALAQAHAGVDLVAPSGMMDGQVAAIRRALDDEGFTSTGILAYAAKFASSFYGPFRDAAECAPQFGDRTGYQMDPANSDEALREVRTDIEEGADLVMVKPALPYLDVIRRVKQETGFPLAAYNVSGEYAMVKAAAMNGWIDGRRATLEILAGIRRAGADLILTYHAKEAADWL